MRLHPTGFSRTAAVTDHPGLGAFKLKTPYSDGTTHVVLEPLDFIARLAALVPRPRVNLTRCHGVFIFIVFLVRIVAVE